MDCLPNALLDSKQRMLSAAKSASKRMKIEGAPLERTPFQDIRNIDPLSLSRKLSPLTGTQLFPDELESKSEN